MLDVLARLFDDAGRLVSVSRSEFGTGVRPMTVAVGLHFESLTVEFRADEDLDTLVAKLGPVPPGPNETRREIGELPPWNACVGLGLQWLWRLTNHQGYNDGVRMEFGEPERSPGVVVELIVAGSAIETFAVNRT